MNKKRFSLARPPSINKILPFIVQSISQLSTLRTNPTKQNQPQPTLETQQHVSPPSYQREEEEVEKRQSLLLNDPFVRVLSRVLKKEKYSNKPVSLFGIWGREKKWLDVVEKGLKREYNGWMEEENKPYFGIVGGDTSESFIFTQDIIPQFLGNNHSKNINKTQHLKLMLQYSISDTVFLLINPSDTPLQQFFLQLCSKISDNLFIFQQISQNIKPNLILIKVKQHQWNESLVEEKWRLFLTELNTWNHFKSVEVIEVSERQFDVKQKVQQIKEVEETDEEVVNKNLYYSRDREMIRAVNNRLTICSHIKQFIRYQAAKPSLILNELITGNIVSSIINKFAYHLTYSTYLNVYNIYEEVIEEETELFEYGYGVEFNRVIDMEMSRCRGNLRSRTSRRKGENTEAEMELRKENMYLAVTNTKRVLAKLFNSYGINSRRQKMRRIQTKQFQLINTQIQYKRQEYNKQLFSCLYKTYMISRPFSFIKCKKMLNQLQEDYINDGYLEDIKQFLSNLVSEYSEQLLMGDELNGFITMNSRIDQYIEDTKYKVKIEEDKILRLHNNQYVRLLEYNRKKEEIDRQIKGKRKKKDNVLEGLLKEKMENQERKIEEYRKLVGGLEVLERLGEKVQKREREFQGKLSEIEIMKEQLERIRREEEQMERLQKEQRQQQIERQAERLVLQKKSSRRKTLDLIVNCQGSHQNQSESRVDLLNQNDKEETRRGKESPNPKKKKRKSFWSCFGC